MVDGPTTETALAQTAASETRQLELAVLGDIAAGLAKTAGALVDRVRVDPVRRTGVRLVATALYDVWLLCWPPGTSVSPHDHGVSSGAFSVVHGKLREVRWHAGVARARSVTPGQVFTIDRGVVHDVIGGPTASLSVHVYSPPLTSMVFYEGSGDAAVGLLDVDDPSLSPAQALPGPWD